jgi:hypothetical protein
LQYGGIGTTTLDPSKTYKGMFDGIYKIAKYEGVRGLYKVIKVKSFKSGKLVF